jgi:hypothetical protein
MNPTLVFKKTHRFIAASLLAVASLVIANQPAAAVRGVYVGGDFYPPVTNLAAAKTSGFNAFFLFTLHIYANGDVYYNNTLVVSNVTP